MRFKKLLLFLLIIFLLSGCSSGFTNNTISTKELSWLKSQIESDVGNCDIQTISRNDPRFIDSQNNIVNIVIICKDSSLTKMSDDELKSYGKNLFAAVLHQSVHLFFDKYLNSSPTDLCIQVFDVKDRFMSIVHMSNIDLVPYQSSSECSLCEDCKTQTMLTQEVSDFVTGFLEISYLGQSYSVNTTGEDVLNIEARINDNRYYDFTYDEMMSFVSSRADFNDFNQVCRDRYNKPVSLTVIDVKDRVIYKGSK